MTDHHSPDTLLEEALKIVDLQARDAYLDDVCGGDTALREDVESLLAAHFAAEGFMATGDESIWLPQTEKEGDWIGRYRLLEMIGDGGFGRVWMAEQREPMERKVALKIVKLGMDTGQVVARFEAERQALAMMDHPHIATVLDGGATENGRPYFVMELVRGVPITTYCDANKLSPRARIELFRKVCEAVQHAHLKGIIHRDLKPSNILVTVQDDKPVPKVIDFGVAKALQKRLTERTLFTRMAQWVGTPEYMSPEQAGLGSHDVDTRSDVYSLGVILYELLTGRTPFGARDLRGEGLEGILRKIREEDPPKASTRLSSLTREEMTDIADHRGQSPAKLGHLIKGELDWILTKALERDRTRRYETANAFALDLERYTAGASISAAPPSFGYRVGKLMRKHWKVASLAAVFVLLLVTGAAVSTLQALRISKAREEVIVALDEKDQVLIEKGRALVRSEALRLGAQSSLALDEDPGLALLLAIEAVERHPSLVTNQSLVEALGELREHKRLIGHNSGITNASFSPDGTRVLTSQGARGNMPVRVWDVASGHQLAVLKGKRPIQWAVFSPDGKRIVTTEMGSVLRVWDAVTAIEIRSQESRVHRFPREAFSPDGSRLVLPDDGRNAVIIDLDSGEVVRTFEGHTKGVYIAAFALNGERVVTAASDQTVRIWDSRTGRELQTLDWLVGKHDAAARSATAEPIPLLPNIKAGSSDGRTMLVGTVYHSRLFDIEKGEFRDATISGRYASFRAGGRRVLAYSGGDQWPTIAIVDPLSGEQIHKLEGHSRGLTAATFSPDGKLVASGSYDKTVRIWDAEDGSEFATLKGHRARIDVVEFSPDSRYVISADTTGDVRLWSVENWRQRSLIRAGDGLHGAVFDPTGTRMVALRPTDLVTAIWNLADGTKVAELEGRTLGGSFSFDGRFVLTRTGGIHETATGRVVRRLEPTRGRFAVGGYSPRGDRIVMGSTDNEALIIDPESGAVLHVLPHEGSVGELAFSADGHFVATASSDRMTRVWELASGALVVSLGKHEGRLRAIALAPDAKHIAVAFWDGSAKLWKRDGELVTDLKDPIATGTVEFSADGRYLLTYKGFTNGFARVWEVESGREIAALGSEDSKMDVAAFSADGTRVFTVSEDGTLRVWNPATGEELAAFPKAASDPMAIHPDGGRVVTRSGPSCVIRSIEDGRVMTELFDNEGDVRRLAISPDGKLVLAAFLRDGASIWNPQSRKVVANLQGGHGWQIRGLAFSPDGRKVATASSDRTARTWNALNGESIAIFENHEGAVNSVAFLDSNRVVTTSDDRTARIWDASTGEELHVLGGHDLPVNSAIPTRDGKRVLTLGNDSALRIFDAATGEQIVAFEGHEGEGGITTASFGPDEKRVVSVSSGWISEVRGSSSKSRSNPTTRIWDVATGGERLRLGTAEKTRVAAFSPDGRRIATVSPSGLQIFDSFTGELHGTCEVGERFLHDLSYSPDGRLLLATEFDGAAYLHGADTAEVLVVYAMANGVCRAQFTPDGRQVITEDPKGFHRLWPVDLLSEAKRVKPRELTDRERERYGIR